MNDSFHELAGYATAPNERIIDGTIGKCLENI
jgi:hypothetical protein